MTTSQERISSRKTFPVAFESIRYKNRKEKLEILPVSSRLGNFQCSPLAYWGQNLIGRKCHVNGVQPPLARYVHCELSSCNYLWNFTELTSAKWLHMLTILQNGKSFLEEDQIQDKLNSAKPLEMDDNFRARQLPWKQTKLNPCSSLYFRVKLW